MIIKIADNIISPLGDTTEKNFQALMAGESAIRLHETLFPPVEPFCASLFDKRPNFTDLCIRSAEKALAQTAIDATQKNVVFILSTTKGDNLQLLEPAQTIARYFGNPNQPIVVSNACTSGVCAQIAAFRLLSNLFDVAIVIGCDVQTKFIVSGFQSFKALSNEPCKPFDNDRKGLNLGEAAATIILKKTVDKENGWELKCGSIHNDANHISGPSRTGEGSFQCLQDVLKQVQNIHDLAFVNVHGTATNYNDEMEAIAITRAGLQDIPVNALKGYYGHTMGAAGILETILSMRAIENGTIIGTKGYDTCGTTNMLNISKENRTTNKQSFIKLLSGFGGCNAALLYEQK